MSANRPRVIHLFFLSFFLFFSNRTADASLRDEATFVSVNVSRVDIKKALPIDG